MKRFAIALVGMFVAAQTFGAMLSQGTRELQFSGEINDQGGNTFINMALGGGYFLIDNFEVGAIFDITRTSGESAGVKFTDSTYAFGVFGEFDVDFGSPVVPYVGAKGVYAFNKTETDVGDSNDNGADVAGYGGVKVFVVDNVALFGQFEYHKATEDIYRDDVGPKDTAWFMTFGTRFMF